MTLIFHTLVRLCDICFSCVWFISHHIMSFRLIHISNNVFPFCEDWMISHFVYIPHFLDPFIRWWTLRFFPYLGNRAQCNNKHGSADFFEIVILFIFGNIPTSEITGSHGSSVLIFRGTSTLFSKWLYQFTFLPTG